MLQLNRHIDDNHQELPEEEQDEVKTWFDKQVLKAKRFQPLSLLNQKLRGLESFESNESAPIHAQAAGPATYHSASSPAAAGKAPDSPIDPDELITRKHWQRTTADDYCTDPTCGRSLGPLSGSINCRHCGRLFCEMHTMYQMKLSRSAHHEPVRGYWARVCETCYKSRQGYNDHTGLVVDHTAAFSKIRGAKVERQNLEASRLEKRLTKLTRLLANPPDKLSMPNGSMLSPMASLAGQKHPRKLIEQSIVAWEDDNQVVKCPFCQQEFGSWTFRRHHCRICGRVVCADPETQCSSHVGLTVANSRPPLATSSIRRTANSMAAISPATEKPTPPSTPGQVNIDVRMCRDCKHSIFSGREFAESIEQKPADQRMYETLRQFEAGIRELLPTFHRVLLALQPERTETGEVDLSKPPPTHAQIQEAAKIRKRLVDAFAKYGQAAKRIRDLPSQSPTQRKLQTAVYTYASGFLHTNMLPLKSLPALLRSNSVPSSSSHLHLSSSGSPRPRSGLRHSQLASQAGDSPSAPGSVATTTDDAASTVVSQLEVEEKDVRERLVVLEEQRFMVDDMLRAATAARRFDEVSALSRNRDELQAEIDGLAERVGSLEARWEGVYAGN